MRVFFFNQTSCIKDKKTKNSNKQMSKVVTVTELFLLMISKYIYIKKRKAHKKLQVVVKIYEIIFHLRRLTSFVTKTFCKRILYIPG